LRVRYLTQAGTSPPTFVVFTSSRSPKAKLHFSYERYLINRLREEFEFFATPIRIKQRRKPGEGSHKLAREAYAALASDDFWQFIARLNRDGHTVLLTTHYLEEAEALCSRIAMLKQGRVVALDRTANLLAGTASTMLRFKTDDPLPAAVAAHARVTGRIAQVSAHDATEVEVILGQLRAGGVRVEDLEIGRADLEDVFLEIMSGGDGKPVSAAPVHLPVE
jgi:hypothetical protein